MFDSTEDPTRDTSHRPWPLPDAPWVMAQRWSNLLFAHWPVRTDAIRALVPSSLPLDLHDNTAWVTIAPFYVSHLHARGIPPLPFTSAFPELNVRTYVTLGGKPGVYFFSLDAGNAAAVLGARTLYHLPYFDADMSIHERDGWFEYRSHRTDDRAPAADLVARYRPVGEPSHAEPGSLDDWLSARYCLYAVGSDGAVYRAEIHHRPWPLQDAEAEIEVNTMARAADIVLADQPPRLSFAKQLDVVIWLPERCRSA
jgi:uncharacterized protein YqjF (DUF2071 family)